MENREIEPEKQYEEPAVEKVEHAEEKEEKEVVIENIFENEKEVDATDRNLDGIILPTDSFKMIVSFIKNINGELASLPEKEAAKFFTDEENLALGVTFSSAGTTVKNNVFLDKLNDVSVNWDNILTYAGKDLGIRVIPHKTSNSKKVYKSDSSISRFLSYLGKGGVTQIPLYHSGFWITLKPISDSDLINLELQLANEQIELGRKTNGMVYSNYNVVFVRILTDFIMGHIENTTLKLDNGEDIRDYIKIQDLYPLVLGVITLLYPTGFNNFRTCKNSVVLTEDKKPKCSYVVQAKVDPKKLLWVNKDGLENYHKNIMIKRVPNSVTLDEVIEYQNTLPSNKELTATMILKDNVEVKITYKIPTISEHIDAGQTWINNIIDLVEESLTEDVNINEKNRRIAKMSKSSILNIYRHFVKNISIGDDVFTDDAIPGILDIIANTKGYKEFKTDVEHYISNNVVAIVAIPNYTCPKCKEDQGEEINTTFREFIPLGVLENFFDLSTLKTTKIDEREISDM